MKLYRFLFFFTILVLLTSLSCQAVLVHPLAPKPILTPQQSPIISPTRTPIPTPSKTVVPTPTESPAGEFQFGETVALDFLRADWQDKGSALVHNSLPGCAVVASGGGDFPPGSTASVIGGYSWLVGNGAYVLKIGDQVAGEIDAYFGNRKTDCRKAVESLLLTIHAVQSYAQAGVCHDAPKQRLQVGDAATVLTSSYLRNVPRWAEGTRTRMVGPAEKLVVKIIGGPVCAIYNLGEYSYWQVKLSSGEEGWMAEGGQREYYLAPENSQ